MERYARGGNGTGEVGEVGGGGDDEVGIHCFMYVEQLGMKVVVRTREIYEGCDQHIPTAR